MNSLAPSGPVLTGNVLHGFVAHRIREMGADPKLFRPDALDLFVAYTNGSVRQLDALLRLTLFLASTENAESVNAELVEKAASTMYLPLCAGAIPEAVGGGQFLGPLPQDRLIPPSTSYPRRGFPRARLIGGHFAFMIAVGALLSPAPIFDVSPGQPIQESTISAASLPEKTHEEAVPALQTEATSDSSGSPLASNSVPTLATTGPPASLAAPFPRVIIDFEGNSRFSEYQAKSLGIALRAIGFHVIAVVHQRSVPTQAVRYYYPGDESFAEHVAQALGQDWRSRIVLVPEAREAVYPGLVSISIPGD